MFSKVIPIGSVGQLELSEEAGVVKAVVSVSEQAGGGSVAGFAKVSVSAQAEMDAHVLMDAGLEIAKLKFPAAAVLIDGLKAIIDEQIKKV